VSEDGLGTMWFAGSEGVFLLHRGLEAQPVPQKSEHYTTIVAGKPKGGALLSLWGGPVYRKSIKSREPYDSSYDLLHKQYPYVRNLIEHQGDLWLVQEGGHQKLQEGQFVFEQPAIITSPEDRVHSIASDGKNTLYAGFSRSGLFQFRDDQWNLLRRTDSIVFAIEIDQKGGIWINDGGKSLQWLENNHSPWRTISTNKLGLQDHFSFLSGSDGGLWFHHMNKGVSRYDQLSLEAHLRGEIESLEKNHRFDLNDGLSSESSGHILNRSITEDQQGRIWVATNQGACACDP